MTHPRLKPLKNVIKSNSWTSGCYRASEVERARLGYKHRKLNQIRVQSWLILSLVLHAFRFPFIRSLIHSLTRLLASQQSIYFWALSFFPLIKKSYKMISSFPEIQTANMDLDATNFSNGALCNAAVSCESSNSHLASSLQLSHGMYILLISTSNSETPSSKSS